jgi:Ca2+-binding EF-hand superfamily protein
VKLTRIVLLGAVAVLLLTGSDSFAGAAKGQGDAFVAAFQARFDLIDANNDGKVSRKEYVEFHSKQAGKRFDQVDKNKKGYVTKEEVQQVVEKASTKMQENRKKWLEKKQQKQQMQQEQQPE